MANRRLLIATVLTAIFLFGSGAGAVDKKTAFRIEKAIHEYNQEIISSRRFLHMNPELSYQEFETAKLIASKLISLGLEIKTGVAKTGVIGLLRGDQKGVTVALRADMDALPIQELTDLPYKSLNPGVMHACGHDIHAAIALGTAMVLSKMKDKIKGNIKFIFQPAEEQSPQRDEGGASLMIREGVLESPPVNAIFGCHVWPESVGTALFSPGVVMASADWFSIAIKGKGTHGAWPQEGIDAIALAAQVVTGIQSISSRSIDPSDPAVVTIGRIQGGTNAALIAEDVRLEGTVRTLSESNRQKIETLIESIVRGITRPFDASYTYVYTRGAPALYNHPELATVMAPSLVEILGQSNVKPIKPQMLADDFSFYCQKIPGFFFFLGVKPPMQTDMAPLHSPLFNPDERSIPLGIKLMCHLLLDALDYQSRLETSPS